MKLVMLLGLLLGLATVLASMQYVSAGKGNGNDKSQKFEKCWTKTIHDIRVDESIMNPIKASTKQQVMSNNMTSVALDQKSTNPNNGFYVAIRDCMNMGS